MSYNFLVVDDSKTARLVLAKVLKISGLPLGEIHMAENGSQALALLKENWVDLVLTDLHMPVMSGVEMVAAMAADGLMETVPVIVITSDASQTRMEDLRQQGIRDYLCKPVRPESIKKAIESILGTDQ